MLAGANRQESHKGNLHTGQGTQGIPSGVGDVESSAVSAHANEDKGVQGHQTGNECVATPRGHHVTVEESTQSSPQDGTKL